MSLDMFLIVAQSFVYLGLEQHTFGLEKVYLLLKVVEGLELRIISLLYEKVFLSYLECLLEHLKL